MIFELGKEYIVDVTEKGIIPLMVFDKDRWFDKDHDDLDFLTDEEKTIVVNDVLDKIRAEIGKSKTEHEMQIAEKDIKAKLLISDIYCDIVNILDKCKAESEVKNDNYS